MALKSVSIVAGITEHGLFQKENISISVSPALFLINFRFGIHFHGIDLDMNSEHGLVRWNLGANELANCLMRSRAKYEVKRFSLHQITAV
jgi:hypothetical protein